MATALADNAMIGSVSLVVAGAMIDYYSFCLPLCNETMVVLADDDNGPWSVERDEWWPVAKPRRIGGKEEKWREMALVERSSYSDNDGQNKLYSVSLSDRT